MAAEMAHIFMTDSQELVPDSPAENADYFAALVSLSLAGDENAFEQIMLATQQRVVSIAWRMLGNSDDAREATQDVYLRAFRYLGRFRIGEDFRAWLYRITVNVCHDFARKRRLTEATAFDELAADLGSAALDAAQSGVDLESLVLHEQQLALVRRALQSLPPKERAALVLRDLEGFSTEQVARALGSRPVTVRSQVSSARAKIKTYCENLTRRRSAS
jgi:RNA polymerase sigma-70 factor (ECF subfamily)